MIRRRGFVFDGRAHSGGHPHLFRWVTDAGGGIGVRLQTWPHCTPGAQSAVFARTVRDDLFKPILTALSHDLEAKGAYGRCLLHAHIDGISGSMLHPEHGGGGIIDESPIQLGSELVIPAEASEIDAQTHAWPPSSNALPTVGASTPDPADAPLTVQNGPTARCHRAVRRASVGVPVVGAVLVSTISENLARPAWPMARMRDP